MAPPTPIADLASDSARVVGTPDGIQLLGSLCRACHTPAFPARTLCYHCGGTEVDLAPVGARGRVYAGTTVHVSSVRATPYHLAYVDLDGGPRVLGRVDTPAGIGDVVHVTGSGQDWSFTR